MGLTEVGVRDEGYFMGRPKIRTEAEKEETKRLWYLANRERLLEKGRQYYIEHREQRLQYDHSRPEIHRRQREKARLNILTHYSLTNPPSCAHCGIDDIDVLCLDHINGGGLKQLRELGKHSGTSYWNWIRNQGYPPDYQVLCRNCNWKKRIREDGR